MPRSTPSVDLCRRHLVSWPLAAAGAAFLSACDFRSKTAPGLPHDFYVWQRVWTPPLEQALVQAAPDVRSWRVLSLQLGGPSANPVAIDWIALAATRRPVIAVVRIEGTSAALYNEAAATGLTQHLRDLLARSAQQGVALAGIELDHDCATSQLAAYASWLQRLRASWQAWPELGRLPLSITALPAWRISPDLPALLRTADESVLQVHAVQRPGAGLFDASSAQHWAQAWAQIAPHPFRLALPCYGSRVSYDEWGEPVAVESEAGVTLRSAHEQELTASPREAATLLAELQARLPAHLAGVVWFRLPMANDQRAWRLPTWRAVVQGRVPAQVDRAMQASLRPAHASEASGPDPGLFDVVLRNTADFDIDLPLAIALPESAQVADGRQNYSIDLLARPVRLLRRQAGWLRPQSELTIGWVRLGPQDKPTSHAELSIIEH